MYSVVNGVASVFIKQKDGLHLNKELVTLGFADYCEESYASKVIDMTLISLLLNDYNNLTIY